MVPWLAVSVLPTCATPEIDGAPVAALLSEALVEPVPQVDREPSPSAFVARTCT